MKVTLKPAGLVCLAGAFCLLLILAFWKYNRLTVPEDGKAPVAANTMPSATATASTTVANATPSNPLLESGSSGKRKPLPPGVLLVPDIASDDWKTLAGEAQLDQSIVDASVPGHPRARRIIVTKVGVNPWDPQIAHSLDAPFRKNKRIQLTYWARSKDSCPLAAVVEQSAEPYTKVVMHEEKLTPEWKQYKEEWLQPSDTSAGWAKADFQLGYKAGEIEVTGVVIRLVP